MSMRLSALCVFKLAIAGAVLGGALQAATTPVLVELFTSEGCSDCPPADALLQGLREGQIVQGVRVIAMSEHVDYWNHLGWSDPFSSPQMSTRQQGYATKFSIDGPYTPQMVVDGADQFVGSDAARARRSIAVAAQRQKLDVTADIGDGGMMHIVVPASPVAADVFLAITYDPEPSAVKKGENSGRRLTHVSVVKSLKRLGEVSGKKPFDARLRLVGERAVVFVQTAGQGRVLGVAEVNARQSAGTVARWSPQK